LTIEYYYGKIGYQLWFKKGNIHREKGLPAYVWYKNEKIYRQRWYKNGVEIKQQIFK
jgi:hypothetical protein